jgi:enamine deaminase RidA (YjgF/YER057c/UK114 family)
MTNQFDLNKFNSFLDSAAQAISCDSECQRNKTEQQLKNKYLTSKSNLILAEPQFQVAKQNYYTYVSGQSGYNEIIEHELNQKADVFVEKFKENYDLEKNKIKTQLETYNGLLINFRNIVDLHKQYKKENIKLFQELKDETNDILTNERKTYYEDQENSYLNVYYYYFLFVIYCIVFICFCIFSIIYPSLINWKIRLFLGLIFVILPFISTWILGKTIQLLYWLFDLLPKNVYK